MKYRVYYTDKNGDNTSCWVNASDIQDAEMKVRDEYWDVARIDHIQHINN